MSVSAINQLNQGSLPSGVAAPAIPGGPTLPQKQAQDPRVIAAQQQAADSQKEQADIAARKQAELAPVSADVAQKNQDLSAMATKGPEQQAMPENTAKHIDQKTLSDSFSSFVALGALAGLLSKTPMTAALNNMTAAIQGVEAGDQAQYDRSYKEFQQNYQKATDYNKAKLDEYNRVFANAKTSLDEKMREAGLIAAKYGDELTRAEVRNQNYKGVLQAVDSSMTAQQRADEHKQTMDAEHQRISAQFEQAAEQKRHNMAEEENQKNGGKGTLQYKLNELDSLKASGAINDKEYATKRKGLIEGIAGPKIGEEKSFGQATPLILANKEITALEKSGTHMPFAGDIHIDSGGIPSAAGRFGIRRSLTDDEQQLVTAAQLYAESAGHIQSGARLTQAAFDRVIREFIPMKGDKPGTIAEKQAHRDALEQSARLMSGKLGSQLAPHDGAPADASETKTIGGVNYHKVNGQWMQE